MPVAFRTGRLSTFVLPLSSKKSKRVIFNVIPQVYKTFGASLTDGLYVLKLLAFDNAQADKKQIGSKRFVVAR